MDARTFVLLALTAGTFLITYPTGILLARSLGIDHYDEYAIAVAAVTMLSTFSELGAGKLAMRILPAYAETGEWGSARGYRRFAGRAILLASVLVAGIAFIMERLADETAGVTTLGMAVMFLPAMALTGYGADVVQANRATMRAALVSRTVVPGVTLALVVAWLSLVGDLTAPTAVVLFGSGSVAGVVLIRAFLIRTTPAELTGATVVLMPTRWLAEALPFMGAALLMVAMARAGLIVLGQVAPDGDVSTFAVALETGTFLYLVAKSTDKMYLPQISVLIERGDTAAMIHERNRRLRWVGAICTAFVSAIVLFGREILALFGPGFSEGYAALVIVSVGSAVWTLFSLAPSYLQYVGRTRFVILATSACVVASVVLTWHLGSRYGDTGAALAFAVPVSVLYVGLSIHAWRHVVGVLEGRTGED